MTEAIATFSVFTFRFDSES